MSFYEFAVRMPDSKNGGDLGSFYDVPSSCLVQKEREVVMSELYELALSVNYGCFPNY